MKLWSKGNGNAASGKENSHQQSVESFTVGKDREMDIVLAPFDVLGNIAHAKMLATIGLLTKDESLQIVEELKNIYASVQHSAFSISPDVEDIHSQIELLLTKKLGDTGKKIHSARSRNDQVLVDVKLYLRHAIEELVNDINEFFGLLIEQSNRYQHHLLPGYTHLQIAMPSSFGLWFGAYAESLVDDVTVLQGAYSVVNKNPLGSAAGYGSSFPINRTMTTELLGFNDLNYNVVYAQMGRGKAERVTAQAMANVADTLARLSMDMCLYLNQNFDFISFPSSLTTGSSIMPHKKNPDVFELIRSHCNRIKALPNEIMMMTTNLPSGYHRDLQLLKEHLFPAFTTLKDCLQMAGLMLSNIIIKDDILNNDKYQYLFTVEAVNELVLKGVPFRDAYKTIGQQVEDGTFNYVAGKQLNHTHEGSLGNLCNQHIVSAMHKSIASFNFVKVQNAINQLLEK